MMMKILNVLLTSHVLASRLFSHYYGENTHHYLTLQFQGARGKKRKLTPRTQRDTYIHLPSIIYHISFPSNPKQHHVFG
jgi:hypothetical protein